MIEYFIVAIGGIIVGFISAIPTGPVGLICFQRTLTRGRLSGLATGLGAAVADVILASIGAFSMTIIFSFISREHVTLRIISGVCLLVLGFITYKSKLPEKKSRKDTTLGSIQEFLSGFILTITNPITVAVFFIAFANISHRIGKGLDIATAFVIGIFLGSYMWWIILTIIADSLSHKINHGHIEKISKIFGMVIILLGVIVVSGVVLKVLV